MLIMSAKPLTASAANESRERLREPEDDHAPAEDGDDDQGFRPAIPCSGRRVSMIPASRAPTAGALLSTPSPTGPTSRMSREERQQCDGAAEQHRDEVERDRAQEHRCAADEAEAREQRAEPRPDDLHRTLLDDPRPDRHRQRRCGEHQQRAERVDGLRVDREDDAADRRPRDDGRLEDGRAERERPRRRAAARRASATSSGSPGCRARPTYRSRRRGRGTARASRRRRG